MTYFNDNRWQQIAYSALAPGVAATPSVSFTYDSAYPRLSTMVDGTGTTTYAYNPIPSVAPPLGAGRLASVDGPLTNDVMAETVPPKRIAGRMFVEEKEPQRPAGM